MEVAPAKVVYHCQIYHLFSAKFVFFFCQHFISAYEEEKFILKPIMVIIFSVRYHVNIMIDGLKVKNTFIFVKLLNYTVLLPTQTCLNI